MAPATGAWPALGAVDAGPALVSSVSPSPSSGLDLPVQAQYAISEAVGRQEPSYAMEAQGAGHALSSATNGYEAIVDAGGLRVTSGADDWSLTVTGIGYGDDLKALGPAQETVSGNRVDYDYGGVSQWFVNGPLGLQQGFTLAQRPTGGDGLLTVDLALGGTLIATADAGGRSVTLARADGSPALSYGGLIAYDATGRETPAYLSVRSTADGDLLSIQVDDADAVYPLVIDPFVQQVKLPNPTSQQLMFFGYSVSVSGDGNRAVVGANRERVNGQDGAGAVYVFDRSGTSWSLTAKLTASDGLAGSQMGYSVAISLDGTTVAAGAANAPINGVAGRGAVYVFSNPGDGWRQVDKLIAADGAEGDFLGATVSISGNGDVIVAGAGNATVAGKAGQGAAYVFTRTSGHSWNQTVKLTASDGAAGAAFGSVVAVSADGGVAAISSPAATISGKAGQGAVYVFDKAGSSWSQTAKLTASGGDAGDLLGLSVSISSDGATVLAGAPLAAFGSNANQGAVYIFARSGASWRPGIKLTASDGAAGDSFGDAVSLSADGNTAIVGAGRAKVGSRLNQGAAYVFSRTGATWGQTDKLVASDGAINDTFGSSVAVSLDGSTVIVGAPSSTVGSTPFRGTAYALSNPTSLSISVNPSSRTVTAGNSTTLTAAATGAANASVQWQVSTGNGVWTNISGATNPWYTITPSLADSGKRYRAVFTSGGQSATTASAQLTVTKADAVLRISSNVNPRRLADPLTFTVDATPAIAGGKVPNGGIVTLNIGPVNLQAKLTNGRAVFSSLPVIPLGTYTVTASYDGANDPNFGSATATMTQVVTRGTATMVGEVPTHAVAGQPVTLKAVLSFEATGETPIGGVVLNDGGQPIRFEAIKPEGDRMVATFTLNSLAPGLHYLRFIYLGERMSEAARTEEIYQMMVVAPGAAAVAPLAANAEGGGAASSSPNGSAGPAAGAPPWGDLVTLAATAPVAQTAFAGIETTFTAAPTSSSNSSAQWQVSKGGGAWTNIPGATNWWYTLTPSLADSGNRYRVVFTGGGSPETTAPAQLTVIKSDTILRISSNVNPRRLADPLTFVVDAAPAVTGGEVPNGGTVTLNIGPVNLQAPMVNGRAVFSSLPVIPLGTYAVTASYDGAKDPNFGSATATMTQIVTRGTATMVGEVPTHAVAGQPVTLKAILSFEATGETPIGGVMLNDGGQPIRFEAIRPEGDRMVATFTVNSLAPGLHYLRFIYLGERMSEPSRTEEIYQMMVVAPGAAAAPLAASAATPFSSPAATTPAPRAAAPAPDLAGAVAALAIEEASSRKPDNSLAPRSGETAPSPALALPSALTARRLQQRYTTAYRAV